MKSNYNSRLLDSSKLDQHLIRDQVKSKVKKVRTGSKKFDLTSET